MNNLFVQCNNCGQRLQIEDEIMFTTCRSCSSTLEIVRTFNSVYTKVTSSDFIEESIETAPKTVSIPKTVNRNELYKQLDILDKEWQNTLPTFMVEGELPDLSGPKHELNLFTFALVIIPLFLIIIGALLKQNFIVIFSFITIGIYMVSTSMTDSNTYNYKKAKTEYERQRKQLLKQLNS